MSFKWNEFKPETAWTEREARFLGVRLPAFLANQLTVTFFYKPLGTKDSK